MIARDAGVFLPKDKGGNRPNYIESTWKPGFGKIYIVLNNCYLASRSYTVLVSIGDLVRLVFTIKSFSKSSKRIEAYYATKGLFISFDLDSRALIIQNLETIRLRIL